MISILEAESPPCLASLTVSLEMNWKLEVFKRGNIPLFVRTNVLFMVVIVISINICIYIYYYLNINNAIFSIRVMSL